MVSEARRTESEEFLQVSHQIILILKSCIQAKNQRKEKYKLRKRMHIHPGLPRMQNFLTYFK
jgi:hypothetical protein